MLALGEIYFSEKYGRYLKGMLDGGAYGCYAGKNYDYVRCVHDPLGTNK